MENGRSDNRSILKPQDQAAKALGTPRRFFKIKAPEHPASYISPPSKARAQKDSSDALFTPKMDVFKQTILNTAYIKTLEIFPSARE